MNKPKLRDYHDLRKPYPQNYVSSGRYTSDYRLPYLKRPQHPLVTFSYEFVRLCACLLLVVILFAVGMLAMKGGI